jgi:hypothetical protein
MLAEVVVIYFMVTPQLLPRGILKSDMRLFDVFRDSNSGSPDYSISHLSATK